MTPLAATLTLGIPLPLVAVRPAGAGPFPILLALHGYAQDAASMLPVARRLAPEGVLLVVPRAPHSTIVPGSETGPERRSGFHWGVAPDHAENRALHRAAVAAALAWAGENGGDLARAALLGFSQPCSFDYRLALDPPHGRPFRALVGICGGLPGEWNDAPDGGATDASRAADALHVSTLGDPFYPLARIAGFSARLAARFRSATHLVLPGGHRVPSAAHRPVSRFLAGALNP